jgi:hypothetical protein
MLDIGKKSDYRRDLKRTNMEVTRNAAQNNKNYRQNEREYDLKILDKINVTH